MDVKENCIFNLMDTNGRRADFIDAMTVYLKCLDETYQELGTTAWKAYPKSSTEFVFYQKAVDASSTTLKEHSGYDSVMETLKKYNIMDEFLACDEEAVRKALGNKYDGFKDKIDKDVEERARHYTTNLVKIGFVTRQRQITEVGKAILEEKSIHRDDIEQLLPIDDANLIYLRQLFKLRIFSNDKSGKFLSPMLAIIYMLLKRRRVSRRNFADIIQTLSPYEPIDDFDQYLEGCFADESEEVDENSKTIKDKIEIPDIIMSSEELDDDTFCNYFTNRKSGKSIKKYLEFYHRLYEFVANKSQKALDKLLDCWEASKKDKSMLNRAFGHSINIFKKVKGNELNAFMQKNSNVPFLQDVSTLNKELYLRFHDSKVHDNRKEYADTTIRLMRMSGIFKYNHGIIELVYPEIFSELFKYVDIDRCIFGQVDPKCINEYNNYFENNSSIVDILKLEDNVDDILSTLKQKYGVSTAGQVSELLMTRRHQEFKDFIKTEFPKDKTIEILEMFHNRISNSKIDNDIKKSVNKIATVPTIFEYIVGIAWYYLSDESFDLLDSFNLTLDADFRPVTHAAGGEGDIVINYDSYVVMLEVTLMNAQAQKRGEWEPVLRHSVNEKAKCLEKFALTFFIADELDANTINIWRAVSMVPLTTTDGTDITIDDVRIMPVSVEELKNFLKDGIPAEKLIDCAEDSYDKLQNGSKPMDSTWREDYIKAVME